MRPNESSDATSRRKLRPSLESLETRDLPSAFTFATTPAATTAQPAAATVQPSGTTTAVNISSKTVSPRNNTASHGLIGKGTLQPFLDQNVIQQSATALYGPPPTPQSPNPNYPTAAEIRREEFTASAVGQYTVGPPTFSDRSERIYASGKNSYSDAWLKSRWQVVLYPPANPAATPNPGDPYANQVTGVAVFVSENYLQSGSGLILDLDANVPPNSDPTALPTHGTWTYDTNSSGAFTGPLGFTQGTGTWTAKYVPDAHPRPGTEGSGTEIFQFQGLYNFSQIVSGVSKVYS